MATKNYQKIYELQRLVKKIKEEIYKLEGINIDDAVERHFIDTLHDYEESLFLKNKKRNKATYLRRSWADHGVKTAIEKSVNRGVTLGYETMITDGKFRLSFEALVLSHGNYFQRAAVENAKAKILLLCRRS